MDNPKIHYSNKDSSSGYGVMELLLVCMNDWVVACTKDNWYGGALKNVHPFLRDELVTVFHCEDRAHKHFLQVIDSAGHVVKPHEFKCDRLMFCPGFFGRGWVLLCDGKFSLDLSLAEWAKLRAPRPDFLL